MASWILAGGCSTGEPDVETRAMELEVDDAAFAAQSRTANLESMRARLTPAAQTELDEIRARLPDDLIVYSSTTSASQVLGTGGGDLLPASCRSSVTGDPPDYEGAARCFVAAKPSLLLDGPSAGRGSPPELEVVSNEAGGRTDAAEQYLRFHQRHQGYVVERRTMALVFIDRRLVTVTGRFAGTANFAEPGVDLPTLESQARALLGPDVHFLGLSYNPTSGELEFGFHNGTTEQRINAADGAPRSTKPVGHGQGLEVNKNVSVYQFSSPTYLGTSNTTALNYSPVSCANGSPGWCDVSGSGTCRYSPRQTGVADRVNTLNITHAATPPNETPIYEDDPCGSTSVFMQLPWNSQNYLEHYAASARRNLDEVASIMQHSESFFWVYPRNPLTILTLNINASSALQDDGHYTPIYFWPDGPKINLKQQPWPSGWSFAPEPSPHITPKIPLKTRCSRIISPNRIASRSKSGSLIIGIAA